MNKRHNATLNLLKVYGLADFKAIYRSVYSDLTPKACERAVTTLLKQGLIAAHQLLGAKKYYTLTPKGARAIDHTDRRAGEPFVAQGLMMNYAIMRFCLMGDVRFDRMTRPEFCAKFPPLVAPRVLGSAFRSRYFLDHSGASKKGGVVRLGLMVCDLGSRPRRIQRKVRREYDKRIKCNAQWKAFIGTDAKLFSICILTFSQAKAKRLETLLENETFHVRVCVVPGLGELLFGGHAK